MLASQVPPHRAVQKWYVVCSESSLGAIVAAIHGAFDQRQHPNALQFGERFFRIVAPTSVTAGAQAIVLSGDPLRTFSNQFSIPITQLYQRGLVSLRDSLQQFLVAHASPPPFRGRPLGFAFRVTPQYG